jgi:hypothetical protein
MPFVIFLNFSEWAFRPKARTSRVEIKEIWAVPMDGATTDQQTQRLRILQRRYTRAVAQGQIFRNAPSRLALSASVRFNAIFRPASS